VWVCVCVCVCVCACACACACACVCVWVLTCHVKHIKESRHTFEDALPHTQRSHVTRMKKPCRHTQWSTSTPRLWGVGEIWVSRFGGFWECSNFSETVIGVDDSLDHSFLHTVWRDFYIWVTWLLLTVWYDFFICVTWLPRVTHFYDRFHWKYYNPAIHHIQELKFPGTNTN